MNVCNQHGNAKENKNTTMEKGASTCPFSARQGYSTRDSRKEYLEAKGLTSRDVPESLEANLDTSQPLYFWQIFSIWGEEPIFALCGQFYDFVYKDKTAPWFKAAFERTAHKQHHIMAQAFFWIDAMGGGRVYHGGSRRLNYHHYYNAEDVMTAKGAAQWMFYMRQAIQAQFHLFDDPRVLPCLVDFLETKMRTYSKVHGWEFDPSDFELASFYPPGRKTGD